MVVGRLEVVAVTGFWVTFAVVVVLGVVIPRVDAKDVVVVIR